MEDDNSSHVDSSTESDNEGDERTTKTVVTPKPGIVYLSKVPAGFNVSQTTTFFTEFGRFATTRIFNQSLTFFPVGSGESSCSLTRMTRRWGSSTESSARAGWSSPPRRWRGSWQKISTANLSAASGRAKPMRSCGTSSIFQGESSWQTRVEYYTFFPASSGST